MIVRATKKLRTLLRDTVPPDADRIDDEWYANVITVRRERWLILMHAPSLFPVAIRNVRAADLRAFHKLACGAIAETAAREDLPLTRFGNLDPASVRVAPTADRRTVGFLTQSTLELEHAIFHGGGPDAVDVAELNAWLARSLRNRDGYIRPIDLAREPRPQPPNA